MALPLELSIIVVRQMAGREGGTLQPMKAQSSNARGRDTHWGF